MDKGEGLTPKKASRRMDGYEIEFAEQTSARQQELKTAPVDMGAPTTSPRWAANHWNGLVSVLPSVEPGFSVWRHPRR